MSSFLRQSLITSVVGSALALTTSIKSAEAASFNFVASNGSFTATANGTSGFTYTTGTGWRTPGQNTVQSNTLTSPTLFVQSNGTVSIGLTHRYNFENFFDGGQLRYSLNGGAFTTQTAFTANGYNRTISSSFANPIAGQQAWSSTSTGYSTPAYITSTATLGSFNAGDVISLQLFGGWDSSAVSTSPNWEIRSLNVGNAELAAAATPVPFEFHSGPGMIIVALGATAMKFKKRQSQQKL